MRTDDAGARGGRHSLYFNLIDAFERPGCPICRLALASAYRWLDSFAYESVNDYTIRESLRASKGFCNTHAWQLIDEIHDLLGPAIVYRDVIHTSLPAVVRAGSGPHSVEDLEPQGICRACIAFRDAEQRYLDVFRESLDEREVQRAYTGGRGACCVPHGRALLERLSRPEAAAKAGELLVARWTDVLERADGRAAPPETRPRYRGVAGASGTFSATGFAAPEPALARDPTLAPVELLAGRPRSGTLRSGLQYTDPLEVEPAADVLMANWAWEEVCVDGACPVCRATLAWEGRALASSANGATIAFLNTGARGICTAHAWRLAEGGHGAALASAAAKEVARMAAALANPGERRKPDNGVLRLSAFFRGGAGAGQRLATWLEPPSDCAWCLRRAAVEAAVLRRLLAALVEDTTMPAMLRRSGGLCRLHFVQAVECSAGTTPAVQSLAQIEVERWTALRDDLLTYLHKQDYTFRSEPKGAEQTAPWRATEQVVGAQHIRP